MMKAKFTVDGLKELEDAIKEIGTLPRKCVLGSSREGAKVALAAAKALAPEDTGNLKKGIVMRGERSTNKLKKVYRIGFDHKMNDVFVRYTASGKRYYYPASMEYGFLQADGTKVPGHHFLRDSLENNAAMIEARMLEKLSQLLDKVLKGR